MKKQLIAILTLVHLSTAGAAIIAVHNGDFGTVGNNGSIQGSIISGGATATPLGAGPWSATTTPFLGLLPPVATIGSGQASITGLLGVAGVSANSGQFYQTLSVPYTANTTYTLTVDLNSAAVLSLNILGHNGIGIALTRGGNTSLVADSNVGRSGNSR